MSRQERPSDEETRLANWMVQAQAGDSGAYRKLLAELDRMLSSYVSNALRKTSTGADPDAVADIVQEALLGIHLKRHTYDPAHRFLPWVFAITRYKMIDLQRKRFSERKRRDFGFELEAVAAPEAEPVPEGSEDIPALLGELSARQRQVLELTKLQGLSVAETSRRTGLSVANIKVLTHRGIARLKKLMEGRRAGS